MTQKTQASLTKKTKKTPKSTPPQKGQTFESHLKELYKRFVIVGISFFFAAIAGYVLREPLQSIILQPLQNQSLVYTSPAGGLNFVIKICILFAFLVTLPVLLFQVLAFLRPAHHSITRKYMHIVLVISILLATLGILTAYYVTLPASLQFLENFASDSVQSLLTTDEYLSFVLLYLCGFAAIFQLPLLMTIINRITTLPTRKLLSISGYVILASFIFGAIITPTPDPLNQFFIAAPTIILYFIGVLAVHVTNRRNS